MISYNGRVVTYNDKWIDPYNPLNLPPYTIRLLYRDGVEPLFSKGDGVQISSSPNIWDVTYDNSDWDWLLSDHKDLLEVLGANSTGVTNMNQMFSGCTSLTSLALFDTSNVTDMGAMFLYCSSLEIVPLFNTSNVTDMNWMFGLCSDLTSVPLFDTSKVTRMDNMFGWCYSLETVPLFDISSATNMYGMFSRCYSLTTVPLFDTSKVTSMGHMFLECYDLTSIPLFDTSNVTDMTNMFARCINVESGALALYQQASSQEYVPSHSGCFSNCGINTTTGAAELAQIPDDWK